MLSRDIAAALNSTATVTSICRVACAGVTLEAAVPLDLILSSWDCFISAFIKPEDLDLDVPIWQSLDSNGHKDLDMGKV